jgi:hypothetical protein
MGGPGSGTWERWDGRKTTVEECDRLDAGRWRREGILGPNVARSGRWTWSQDGVEVAAIGYLVRTGAAEGTAELSYTCRRDDAAPEPIRYPIRLQTTRPHLGGLRWWFTCPLIVAGRPCRRRVATLHLVGRYFGCRTCHGLTYRSCQEAHRDERTARSLARWEAIDAAAIDRATPGELLALLRASHQLADERPG